MASFDSVKSIVGKAINFIHSITDDDSSENRNLQCKEEFETVNQVLIEYNVNQISEEKNMKELVQLTEDLSNALKEMYKKYYEDSNMSEKADGKIDLEKSQQNSDSGNNKEDTDLLRNLKVFSDKVDEFRQNFAKISVQQEIKVEEIKDENMITSKSHKNETKELTGQIGHQKAQEGELKLTERKMGLKQNSVEKSKNKLTEKVDKLIKLKFELPNSEFGNTGCFLRIPSDFLDAKTNITVESIDPLELTYNISAVDEIISNIIRIRSANEEKENLKFDEPFSVILPHVMNRNTTREIKMFKYLQTELKWVLVTSQETIMEDIENSGIKFIEAMFNELPLILTVVNSPKMEELQFGKRGCNWNSVVDNRVNILIPTGAVKINFNIKIRVLSFDSSLIQDMKTKCKGTNADNIYSFTPLFKIEADGRNLLKQASISLPLPQRSISKSDSTNISRTVFNSNTDSRSKANFEKQNSKEKVCLLVLEENKKWTENCDKELKIDDKKDALKFDIDKMMNITYIGVRAKPEATSEQIGNGLKIIMDHLKLHQVKIVVVYHCEISNLIMCTLSPIDRVDRHLRLLKESGFDKDIQISPELEINEREILTLRFRGNIKVENECEEHSEKFMFSSQMKNTVKLKLDVVDKYGQRSKTRYEGFLTITKSKWIKKLQPRVEGQPRKGPPQMVEIEEVISLFATLLTIPKVQSPICSKSISRDFHFTSKDSVTEEFIKQLSVEINDDWISLAKVLRIPKNRIQDFTSNSQNRTSSQIALEVLKLWVKGLPILKKKQQILGKALSLIDRHDLVEQFGM